MWWNLWNIESGWSWGDCSACTASAKKNQRRNWKFTPIPKCQRRKDLCFEVDGQMPALWMIPMYWVHWRRHLLCSIDDVKSTKIHATILSPENPYYYEGERAVNRSSSLSIYLADCLGTRVWFTHDSRKKNVGSRPPGLWREAQVSCMRASMIRLVAPVNGSVGQIWHVLRISIRLLRFKNWRIKFGKNRGINGKYYCTCYFSQHWIENGISLSPTDAAEVSYLTTLIFWKRSWL